MGSLAAGRKLVARRLAVRVASAIETSGKRAIMVTSTTNNAGKSLVVDLLKAELERVAPNRFRVVDTTELAEMNPWSLPDDKVLLVDGPAVLDEAGFVDLRRGWISAFDGALVVVVGRETRREDLAGTVEWLEAAKIPLIGLIWNERVCPPLRTRMRLLATGLTRLARFGRAKGGKARTDSSPAPEQPRET